MAEVDKFKRRVIRAVARLLRKDQTPGEEMWKALQNEAGCDCKLLWQRMRALTLKKMKRLILAEDRLDNIAAVAKMTITDWLLFDLVLVHEEIDVIGQDLKTEPTILTDLFNVVKRFHIEGKQGEALSTAWTAATFYYNSFGRQCSPMLLQRRWYQLKKLTRTNFYKFWFEYRGNPRLLHAAKGHQPSKLQSEIAQRFPHLVTMPFLEWNKMIKEKWIILPEEFEAKIKKLNCKPKPQSNEPDLVLVEPQIETIDLGVESEPDGEPADENSKDSYSNVLNPVALAAAIKKEPEDEYGMDFEDGFDAKALETTETLDDDNAVANTIENTVATVESINNDAEITDELEEMNVLPKICSVAGNFNEDLITTEGTDFLGVNRNEVMDEINNILKSAAEVRKETVEDSIDSSSDIDSNNSEIYKRTQLDAQSMQIESAAQPIDIDQSDDSIAGASSRDKVMTKINNILKSASDSIESSSGKIGPNSKLFKRTNVDAKPTQVELSAQPIDVDEFDKDSLAGSSDPIEVMTKIKNILKSAAEVKKESSRDGIESNSVKTGPESERTNLDAKPMSIESARQPIDIDEYDKYSLEGGSGRIEVMTEINNILESAIQGKTQTHKSFNKTLMAGSELMDVDKSVAEIIEDITEVSDKAIELDSTADDGDKDNVVVNVNLDKITSRNDRDTDANVEFEETADNKDKDGVVTDIIENIKSVPELSSDENVISDPSIDIPTDLTFEDDGIELVDDGIAFEEDNDYATEKIANEKSKIGTSTSGDLENMEDPPKFDLKLLMHPCVYTIKLEDMAVFRNKKFDEVKDKVLLDIAVVESKMHIKQEQFTDIKDEQDGKSIKSEKFSDNDSDVAEDGITDKDKVKLSSYMLQKPKSRSYNPIQLCKNPDFNTRLKRLTAGFLSSNRNRLLLKCLKPLTVDLSKAFEVKLINGTVYLNSEDGPKIKCEKPDVSEELSVAKTAVMPSAMPVQSLIDNSSISLQDLLPSLPKPTIKSYELPSERQKTINLPDINYIRRINQHLLTAEVTPMRIQSNNKYIPPVQLIAVPQANPLNILGKDPKTNELSVVSSGTNVLVNNQEPNSEAIIKSKDVGNTETVTSIPIAPGEKKKKEHVRPTYNLSWNSIKRRTVAKTSEEEFLLTLDALNKMLHLFNDEESKAKAKSDSVNKKSLIKQKLELQRRMDQFEKNIEGTSYESDGENKAKSKTVKPIESKKEKKKEEPPPEAVPLKINIIKDKPYAPYCCWARMKIEAETKKTIRPHQCPRICRCCCRDKFAEKFHRPNRPKPIVNKPSPIVISDDEETKKVCESIETVVNQSRDNMLVPPLTPIKNITTTTPLRKCGKNQTEVSIQCDMSSDTDFSKNNLTSVVSINPSVDPEKTQQSEVITINDADDVSPEKSSKIQRPVRVRKDLILYPQYRTPAPPAPPVKHQRHITIDASQRKVQIHSEPMYFNSDGQEKILYLNNKQKSKDHTSPIFLGENKILLTDVKFPSAAPADLMLQGSKPSVIAKPTIPVEQLITPRVVPQTLPHGVQIILLPDGQLTYTIDPGAKLTEYELSSLPVILDAIRLQLNQTNSIRSTTNEVINLTEQGAVQVNASGETNVTSNIDSVAIRSADEATVEQSEVINLTDQGAVQVNASGETNVNADVISNTDSVAIRSGDEATVEQDKLKSSVAPSNIENPTEPTENSNEDQLRDIQVENLIDASSTNESNVINADAENIPSPKTDVSEVTSRVKKVNEVNQIDKEDTPSLEASDKMLLDQNATVTGDETKNSLDTASQATIEGTTESVNVPENMPENPNESTNSTANSNRKTLLSDLMEMSGISQEDIQTNVPAVNENTVVQPGLVPADPVTDKPTAVLNVPQVSSLVSHPTQVTLSPAMPSIPELTPVTSFSQLKYACEQNGRFFKLDLQLGTLTKIGVCIKKNKPKLSPASNMKQKFVIDLTEDQDVSPDEMTNEAKKTNKNKDVSLDEATLPAHVIQTNKNHVSLDEDILPISVIQTNRSLLKTKNPHTDVVKPLKLFRAIRILKRKHPDTRIPLKITTNLPGNAQDHVKQKEKPDLDQSTVRDKSPRPELLTQETVDDSSLDSDELDQYIWKETETISSSDDDTSDDEPLANKAKRMRGIESQESCRGQINKEPEKVTILNERNPQIECEMEVVNIERLPFEKDIAEERFLGKDIAKGADIAKEANITKDAVMTEDADVIEDADVPQEESLIEEADMSEEADITEEAEFAGVEEVPIEDDINLLPALQVVERMDEDEDDDNCILGF